MDLSERLKRAAESSRLRAAETTVRTWATCPTLLVGPTVPPPLHGFAPRTILGAPWWEKERKKAYESTNFHCKACGTHHTEAKYHQWLEGHEQYDYDYLEGVAVYLGAVPLCHFCHAYVHRGRLELLLRTNRISHQKYAAIIHHAEEVLSAAGVSIPEPYSGIIASNWRLIIEGTEYFPQGQSPASKPNKRSRRKS
jgi:hypothetical protein